MPSHAGGWDVEGEGEAGGEHGELVLSKTQLFGNDTNLFMWSDLS